ncbi:MAG: ANTAR domain-containing protein [Lachnospiraceae bacterium]|nr:ANTAR domain-containing protein [Lachnospiraceae bacterium]
MIDIIVVFPQIKDGQGIRNLLVRNGYRVGIACTSGAQAKSYMDNIDYGIVVCGYKFSDMMYSELYHDLGPTFEMLLVASRAKLEEGVADGIVCVEMPLKSYDLLNTLEMMMQALERIRKKGRRQPKERNIAQKAIIDEAKKLLMDTRNMTEEEAHRFIQKSSMDSGTNMVETAQMVLQIMH